MIGLKHIWNKKLEQHTKNYFEAKVKFDEYEEKYNSLPIEQDWSLFSKRDYYTTLLAGMRECMDINLEKINHYRKLLGLKPINDNNLIVVYYEEA